MSLADLAEGAVLPDWLIRVGIRRLLTKRLRQEVREDVVEQVDTQQDFIQQLRQSPIAIETVAANVQHYEVPTIFFQRVLGPRLKYSCCLYATPETSLAEAEEDMLDLFCRRAGIEDGMRVLELGCGWGSLCLWIAEKYPTTSVLAVSNSRTQREYIVSRCEQLGLKNVDVVTANVANFHTDRQFDRVVSVEMFEHVRNYERLMGRIAGWLDRDGKLAVHIFCHRSTAYPFETEGKDDWMGRHFFTGGIMPSVDLLLHFQQDLVLQNRWAVSGIHYARTLEDWLRVCDTRRSELLPIFQSDLGLREGKLQFQRWRMFFMACAELFAYRGGNEWFVAHYLFANRRMVEHA
jgi:cyclopropane-fatty-acyl-phospholipid synthase